ncbi:putative anti-sigma-YlaC factor YlaD [Lewinella marina]|uniref:Uncharacterized protein n=1 Tax=Neolewinella marina TaxID=438751 RepID=A0A2G0CGU0_9BACT|nr:hypothetical protein [Neolewinella marina]NJB86336.1 putative anti-sigma-YlaC factor YlaD [Neolewinella marina]PHK99194.1 hypothetical protein CGL56_06975 [Neolewinella marina]
MSTPNTSSTLTSFTLVILVVVVLYAPWYPPGWEAVVLPLALGLIALGGYVAWRSTAGEAVEKRLSCLPGIFFFAAAVCFTEDYHPFGEEGLLIILGTLLLAVGGYLTWRAKLPA